MQRDIIIARLDAMLGEIDAIRDILAEHPSDRMLTPAQAALEAGYPPGRSGIERVRDLIRTGRLPSARATSAGRGWLIGSRDLDIIRAHRRAR